MANFRNFDRHETFTPEIAKRVRRMIDDVEDWSISDLNQFRNPVLNKLYGLWDGFFYTDLVDVAKEYNLPRFLVIRLMELMTNIEQDMVVITEEEVHLINVR